MPNDKFSATQVIADHAALELIPETAGRRITRVLLFGGHPDVVPLHSHLIAAMPGAEYFVAHSSENGVTEAAYREELERLESAATSVHFFDPGHRLTPWTQDRLIRCSHADDHRSVLFPVEAGVAFGGDAPFELGVPRILQQLYPERFAPWEQMQYIGQGGVDAYDGDFYPGWDSLIPVDYWHLTAGPGGDRYATPTTMYVGLPTYGAMLWRLELKVELDGDVGSYEELLARLFKKEIFVVNDNYPRYGGHVDVYLTVLEDGDGPKRVILGSADLAVDEYFGGCPVEELPDWMDNAPWRWEDRREAYATIKSQLEQDHEVIEIPLLFPDLEGSQALAMTYNNGLLTCDRSGAKTFLSSSYFFDDPEIDEVVQAIEQRVRETLAALDIELLLIPGGEGTLRFGGELHCTAGVLASHPPFARDDRGVIKELIDRRWKWPKELIPLGERPRPRPPWRKWKR